MKRDFIKVVAASLCLVSLCVGCNEDPTSSAPELSLNTDMQALDSPEAGDFTIEVTTNALTEIVSDRSWCKPEVSTTESGEVKVAVSANTGRFERFARITFTNGGEQEEVVVSQPKGVYKAGMRYEIPIVFHVIYSNAESAQHNPSSEKIYELFNTVVDLYAKCGGDIGVDFVLAEEDESGATLEERGIHRIEQSLATLKCLDVMYESSGKYTHLDWDPRRYINVLLYEFGDEFSIVGLSRFPYLIEPYKLEGMEQLKEYEHADDLGFVYGISLNNEYLERVESEVYNMYDLGETLAHELGHYLGLNHPYSETYDKLGTYNTCDDTDHCADTPSYNRYAYEEVMFYTNMNYIFTDEQIEELSFRTSCEDDSTFRSTNIMDYAIGDSNAFTAEQRERMRYILENSPYIPGCKSTDFEALTPVASRTAVDIPVRTAVCYPVHSH